MTPHQLSEVVVGGGEGDQRQVWRVRGRLSPRDPPRPRRGILRDASSSGGNQQPPPARGSRGSWRSRIPVPVQHLPNFPSPLPRSHPYLYPTRRAAAPTCAAAGTVRDGSGSLPAAGRRAGRAELVGRLPLPGRRQAEHAAAAAAAGLPLPGARGAQTRPRLTLDFPGQLSVPPPGRLCGAQPPRSRAGALSLHPCPLGRGGPGRLGKRSTRLPPGRVQFLRVSQRGSLVLGVWTHARAGGGQELELSPVSHREGGEGPA